MRLSAVIRAPKSDIVFGPWKIGHMPPSEFKLIKTQKTMKYGQGWSWRVVKFTALESRFRLQIMLNESKGICRGTLGIEDGDLVRICCVREFHPSEPGWHCHATYRTDDGVAHWSHHGLKRWPKGPDLHAVYAPDRILALDAALRFYRVEVTGDLL